MMASVKSNLEEFKEIFGLPRIPQRIEIYDNSHNQGSYAIGAMVVATPDGFDKRVTVLSISKIQKSPMMTLQ